jgi:hypothetical protein
VRGAGLTTGGRQDPELGGLDVGGVGVGAGGDEEQVAGAGEGDAALALGGPGEADGGRGCATIALAGWHLPDRAPVPGVIRVERTDRQGDTLSVRADRDPVDPGERDVLVEFGERRRHATTLSRSSAERQN